MAQHVVERVGQGVARQPEPVEQPVIRAARSGGVTPTISPILQAARRPYATASPWSSILVAGRGLDRMTERVAEVERDPTRAGPTFALVGDDDLDLGPRTPLDELGHRAARPRRPGHPRAMSSPCRSSSSNSRSSPSAAILTASPSAARRCRSGSVASSATSMTMSVGWWKAPDEVLALGQVDRGLAADRRIDLGDERRRHVDERDAAQVRRRQEAGGVAERTATDRRPSARRG